MIEEIKGEGVDKALVDALNKLQAGRGLTHSDTIRARACLAMDCLNRLNDALKSEMKHLRECVLTLAGGNMEANVFNNEVNTCEHRLKAFAHNAVYAARAVSSPMMHEIPGALPELKGDEA